MPGFFVSNQCIKFELNNYYPTSCVAEEMKIYNATVKRNTLNKFMQDKAFSDNEEFLVVQEGYLLNKLELFATYQADTVADLMQIMYQHDGDAFFSSFRGAFSGALYDKKQDKWLIYTNHNGDKAVFYTLLEKGFAAGSQVNYVLDACKELNWPLSFDEQAAYQMLTFAFMEANRTYAKEVKRLRGGTYLRICSGVAEVCEYHRFEKHPDRFTGKTESEIVDALDAAFRRAVELEYRKDEEYGCRHLVDMSGGLDSRMNAWVAHNLSEKHLQLITYSKGNYLDELIAKEIAAYWKDEILTKQLDDASFLYDIDEIVLLNGGLSLYSGITGGKQMLESLNMNLYGLEHTGQLGDVLIGSYISTPNGLQKKEPNGRYSDELRERLKTDCANTFTDHELYLIYTRGFRGILNTHQIRDNYTEVVSPFTDVEFLQLCMDIPLELRMNHKLYKKWMLTKYPAAAAFKWEKIDGKITDPKWFLFAKKVIKKGPNKILTKLKLRKDSAGGMNPIGYWMTHNDHLRTFLNEYEQKGYTYLPEGVSETLIQDMKKLYATGNGTEKTMVLTVLGAAKLYFG